MKPSLDNAYLRIERVGEHIADLKAMELNALAFKSDERIFSEEPTLTIVTGDDGTIHDMDFYNILDPILKNLPTEADWSIRLGEAVCNLRAALDYLAYEIACLDSGREQKGTQFPLCSSPDDFAKARQRGWLRGVNVAHRMAIERMQPYKRGQWLETLASLSNPDKHRHLTVLTTNTRAEFMWRIEEEPLQEMVVDVEANRYIAFGDEDKRPVIHTLETLSAEVSKTVDHFKASFQ